MQQPVTQFSEEVICVLSRAMKGLVNGSVAVVDVFFLVEWTVADLEIYKTRANLSSHEQHHLRSKRGRLFKHQLVLPTLHAYYCKLSMF